MTRRAKMFNPQHLNDIADMLVQSLICKETDQDVIKLRSAAVEMKRLYKQVENFEAAALLSKQHLNDALKGATPMQGEF